MKRLHFKLCNICKAPVEGIKRTDRNAYHYPPRCQNCTRKVFDPIKIANKKAAAKKVGELARLPLGTKRKHTSSDNLVYWVVKVAQPNVWEYEHRVLLNAPKNSHVHHINGNTLDNDLSNLVLLTPKEHSTEHGLNGKWSRKFDSCLECKSSTRRHLSKGLCTACYQRLNYKPGRARKK